MLRDDGSDGGGRRRSPRNVLGEPLDICSIKPMTGFYRDGCCNTGREDVGSHTVCAVMTSAFLEFSKSRGNDLSTPAPEFGFPGLKAGDRWCLCAPRWQEAFKAGQASRVVSSLLRPRRTAPLLGTRCRPSVGLIPKICNTIGLNKKRPLCSSRTKRQIFSSDFGLHNARHTAPTRSLIVDPFKGCQTSFTLPCRLPWR
jgi:uncharacterized protein